MILIRKFEDATEFDRTCFQCRLGVSNRQSTQFNKQCRGVFVYMRADLDFTDVYVCNQQLFKCY
jgi:hypothetical protein